MTRIAVALLALIVMATSFARIASASDAVDHLGAPGPIDFGGTDFALAWTSRPSPTYTKQEYVPDGQTVEAYLSMLMLELVEGDIDVRTALSSQVGMLNQRKASDPFVNMEVIENKATGEAILDFILSGQDQGGRTIVEWNAYRYAPFAAGNRRGVVLLAISRRAYGEDVDAFLAKLRGDRPGDIDVLATMPMPEISPPD